MSTKYFLGGSRLYDQVYTQYGPLFYSYKWLLHGVFRIEISNDAVRYVALVHWIGIAGLCGWFAYRAAGSRLLASAGFLLAAMHLDRIANEPGHPQELCGLLVATALVLCALPSAQRGFNLTMGMAGLAAGALVMIKINLGAFLFLAISMAILMDAGQRRLGALLRPLHVGLALAVALIVMRPGLNEQWVLRFSIVWALSLFSVIVVGRSGAPDRLAGHGAYASFVLGGAVMIVGIGLSQWLQGLSIATLIYGIVGQHRKFAAAFYFFPEIPLHAVGIAAGAATLAVLFRQRASFHAAARRHIERVVAGLKLLLGLAAIGAASATYWSEADVDLTDREPFSGISRLLLIYGLPFVWLLLPEASEGRGFSRLALVFVAIFQALQVYPIAGTQMAFGTLPMILVGLLCVHDVATRAEAGSPHRMRVRRLATGLVVAALLMISWRRDATARRHYLESVPLALPGAARIRLPETRVANAVRLVRNLRAHCDTFVSFPGWNSLYFWAEKDPPTSYNATLWPNMLEDRQQEEIAAKISGDPRACFVENLRWQATFDAVNYSPLVWYLRRNFRSAGAIGSYDFRIRNDRSVDGLVP